MSGYEDAYEAAMEPTNSFNWEPGLFAHRKAPAPLEDIYCWRCHKMLNADEFYYCLDCEQECWAYWGA